MGTSLPCASSTSEDDVTVLSSCECFNRDKPLEDLYVFIENDDSKVQEREGASADILHVCDSHEFLCGKNGTPIQEGNKDVNEIEVPRIMDVLPEFINNEAQCTEEIQSASDSFDNVEGLSVTLTSLQLVSCMKGSRTQQGMPENVLLRVKWAPDVYDPPVTSGSPVKGHHRQSKPMKKVHHKQKHSNSKTCHGSSASDKRYASHRSSSSSSSSDRKHASHRSSNIKIDPRIARLKALNGGAAVVNPPGNKLNMDEDGSSDYSVRTIELKCGSSIFMDSLAPLHFPIAEASQVNSARPTILPLPVPIFLP